MVIGITGTDGKTTTSHVLYRILREANIKTSLMTTINAEIDGKSYNTGFHTTTPSPWTIQKMLKKAHGADSTHFVIEVTSHGIDQNRIWGIPFAIAVLTNITHEHLDYHGSYGQYFLTKYSFLQKAKVAVINIDDDSSKKLLKKKFHRLITYGLTSGDISWSDEQFTTSLHGNYNKRNILAAASAAYTLGVSKKVAEKAIKAFTGVKGRFEIVNTDRDITYVIDFAHTPQAFRELLPTIREMNKKRLIHVFGCTGERDKAKRPIMGSLSEKLADVSIITEDDNRSEPFDLIAGQIKSGIKRTKNVFVYKFRQDAINFATSIARTGDVVVLTGKGHEQTILRGKTDYPWSEHKAIQDALKRTSH